MVGRGSHAPARLAQLPADVQGLIAKATAASPADRYATGAAMRSALTMAQLSRGIIASSADLRAQMEQLFDGESGADRRERAALMKLPSPKTVPAIDPHSTRIARAPGAAAAQEPAPVISSPAAVSQQTLELRPVNAVQASAWQTVPTAVRRAATSSFPPAAASWWRRGLAACAVACGVVGAVVVLQPRPVAPPVTSLPPAALAAMPVVPPVKPAAPSVPPPPVPVVQPLAVQPALQEPSAPASNPAAAPKRSTPVRATTTTSAVPAIEQRPDPPPSQQAWPASWPRLPEQKQQLLRERCLQQRCANKRLLGAVVTKDMPKPEIKKLQADLTKCLKACRAASP